MKSRFSYARSLQLATGPYPKLVESSGNLQILFFVGSISILSPHLRKFLRCCFFPTNIFYTFLISPIDAKWPAHLILLRLTTGTLVRRIKIIKPHHHHHPVMKLGHSLARFLRSKADQFPYVNLLSWCVDSTDLLKEFPLLLVEWLHRSKVVPGHHAIEAYWGVKLQLHALFDLDTRYRWLVSFTLRPLHPQGKSPWIHWIGGWVGPRDGLDNVVKRNSQPLPELEPPIIQAVAQRYTTELSRLLKTIKCKIVVSSLLSLSILLYLINLMVFGEEYT
jgi:hypothetical protein